jgi:HK97 family phage prohead protease
MAPYFISDQTDCPDWAVVKEDGVVITCQPTKQDAIDQMVAMSIAEEIEPGGEYSSTRELPDNYRPALAEDVPEGRACGNCFFYNEERINDAGDKAWCEKWDDFVDGAFYCNAWEPDQEERDIDQEAPAYMRAAARRGLEYYEEGLAGDGVTPGTIREAREMAEGRVSDDKWIRIAAWIARHLVDLDSPDANPDSDNYPSAGVVAHLLWGSGPSKRAAQRTKDYADSVVARIRQEETNSMDNKNKWLDVARAIALKIDGPMPVKPEQTPPDPKAPEIRTNSVDFEVRAEGDGMTFTGYASVFNSPSEDLGGFVEYVAPGAFRRSLQSRNEVKLLWNHDAGEPLASLRGGTMQLVEDSRGLKVTATLPQTSRGRDVAELLRLKTIDSMSFGFNVIKDSWASDGKTRTLESVRLFEVSIVSFPAYEATTAQVRSAQTINPDELADALLKLESGEELDTKSAELITDVVAKLKAQPETEEVIDNGLDLLDLKQKQFDLLLKRI